jgi:hypothetical protein
MGFSSLCFIAFPNRKTVAAFAGNALEINGDSRFRGNDLVDLRGKYQLSLSPRANHLPPFPTAPRDAKDRRQPAGG